MLEVTKCLGCAVQRGDKVLKAGFLWTTAEGQRMAAQKGLELGSPSIDNALFATPLVGGLPYPVDSIYDPVHVCADVRNLRSAASGR